MHEKHRERLRERFAKVGLSGWADHEILELLLTYAIARRDTNPTAHLLMERFGSLSNIFAAGVDELCSVEGIGPVAATLLHFQGELLQHMAQNDQLAATASRLNTPADAAGFLISLLRYERAETVYAICLDKRHHILHYERLFLGTLSEAPFYQRPLVEYALRHNAFSVLLAHNHPSGDLVPSNEDVSLTQRAKKALESIDIRLVDHMIVGKEEVYSFALNRVLKSESENTAILTLEEWISRSDLKEAEKKQLLLFTAHMPFSAPLNHEENLQDTLRAAENSGTILHETYLSADGWEDIPD